MGRKRRVEVGASREQFVIDNLQSFILKLRAKGKCSKPFGWPFRLARGCAASLLAAKGYKLERSIFIFGRRGEGPAGARKNSAPAGCRAYCALPRPVRLEAGWVRLRGRGYAIGRVELLGFLAGCAALYSRPGRGRPRSAAQRASAQRVFSYSILIFSDNRIYYISFV